MAITKLERDFRTNQVLPFLNSLEKTYYEPIQQKAIRGSADYILCSQGFFIWLELKSDTGKIRPIQDYKASLVKNKGGGIVLIAKPGNWWKVKDFLTTLDKGIYDKNQLRSIEQSHVSKCIRKTKSNPVEEP